MPFFIPFTEWKNVHKQEELQDVLNALEELPEHTSIALDKGDSGFQVIYKDVIAGNRWYDGDARGQHWFVEGEDGDDPMGLYQYLKYADTVYVLPLQPTYDLIDITDKHHKAKKEAK